MIYLQESFEFSEEICTRKQHKRESKELGKKFICCSFDFLKTFHLSSKRKKHKREAKILLRRLHLKDKFQQKMSPADFLEIGPPVKQSYDIFEEDLAHTFLQRMMILDYRARYILVRQDNPDMSGSVCFSV